MQNENKFNNIQKLYIEIKEGVGRRLLFVHIRLAHVHQGRMVSLFWYFADDMIYDVNIDACPKVCCKDLDFPKINIHLKF